MELKATLMEYTESEFQAFVDKIWAVDLPKPDHDRLINHFDRIVGHPQGADLLFYPDDRFGSNNPAWVVQLVKYWHQKQGLAAFKGGSPILPPPPVAMSPVARGLAAVQKIAADVAKSDQAVEGAFAAFEQGLRHFRSQQGVHLDISAQEEHIRALESVQGETWTALRKFENLKMGVEFAKSDAQRSLAYARSEQAQWQSIAQQVNATHNHFLARLTTLTTRYRVMHDDADMLLSKAQEQLIRSRGLANVGPAHTACVIHGVLSFVDKRPAVMLSAEPSGLELSQQVDLQKSIRSAVAEFSWRNTTDDLVEQNQQAAVLSFEFSSRSDTQAYGASVPLIELLPLEGQDWQWLAANRSEVDMSFRLGTSVIAVKPGAMFKGLREVKTLVQVHIGACRSKDSISRVRVRAAKYDRQLGAFTFTADGSAPITVQWSDPATIEATIPPATTSSRRLGFIHSSPVPTLVMVEGARKDSGVDDYIVVFPTESGLDPVYVVFRPKREYPV